MWNITGYTMARSYYILQIYCTESDYDKISGILHVESVDPSKGWYYEVIRGDEEEPYDFINEFLDLLEGKYEALEELGISRENIIFWLIYEYDEQCNMEFEPGALKRLGENGIGLSVSCYQSNMESTADIVYGLN